jgi:hypothetical protein
MNKKKGKKLFFFWIRVPQEYHRSTMGVPVATKIKIK